jgi:hypothetical protein
MSNGNSESVSQIIELARIVRSEMAQQETTIQDEIDDIDDIQWERPLTDAEREQRKQLRVAQTNVRAAMVQLSNVSVRALDQAPEISRLINAFEAINNDLTKDIEDIHEAAAVAEAIQNAVAQIADIAAKVAKLLAPV